MRELKHPITHAIYGIDTETKLVRIRYRGMTGLYSDKGVWVSGDIFDVDPEMCVWVGGLSVDTLQTTFKLV